MAAPPLDPTGGRMTMWRNWTTHNLIAHPLSEIAHLLGLDEWADLIHDSTIPEHEPGTGRG